jgi:uncharacterized glyoxalase superfamily protein PhnB
MDPRTDAEVIASSMTSPSSFGELFDRHATTMFRYFVRRVGPDQADSLLGELFRIAFERRAPRARLRELVGESGEQRVTQTLRPDRIFPVDESDPGIFKREKESFMSAIEASPPRDSATRHSPAMYPRLAYEDEVAALEYLTRVFQFKERREARMGRGDEKEGMLAWLEFGDGVVMIGRATPAAREVHHLYSPREVGHATVVINVAVRAIDAHYAHAVGEGATITMPIEDAFYGFRRYEADDLEGHHWHFHKSLADIRAREERAGVTRP